MSNKIFIIPGFHDSGAAHWQTWLQQQLPDSLRLRDVNWELPDLTSWVDQAHRQLAAVKQPVWLVAHSFGSLVAATLAAEIPDHIAGVLFVAPADPQRFDMNGGLRDSAHDGTPQQRASVADILPYTLPDEVKSVVIASENDPWLGFADAQSMARRWHSHFVNLGAVGHINTDSGYGPWPGLLQQLQRLRQEAVPGFHRLCRHSLEPGSSPAAASVNPVHVHASRAAQQLNTATHLRFAF